MVWQSYAGRNYQPILFPAAFSCSEAGVRLRLSYYSTMARDSFWRKNACPGDVLSGGRAAAGQHACWKLIKHSYSSPPAILTYKQRPCGEE